jgi:hypothetical protein
MVVERVGIEHRVAAADKPEIAVENAVLTVPSVTSVVLNR